MLKMEKSNKTENDVKTEEDIIPTQDTLNDFDGVIDGFINSFLEKRKPNW